MRILADTNILLDYLLGRQPFYDSAEKIISLCSDKEIECCVSSQSVSDVFYIARKSYTESKLRQVLLKLCDIFDLIGNEKNKVVSALENSDFKDFEDCIQSECALEFNADYIVTRNIKDFAFSKIPAVSPEDFLSRFNQTA